ncbi:hypothetical protein D3C81_1750790 [compost metagenome]
MMNGCLSKQRCQCLFGYLNKSRIIYGRRITEFIAYLCLGVHPCRKHFGKLCNTALHPLTGTLMNGAYRTAHFHRIRDNVGQAPAVNRSHAEHDRLRRIAFTADERLQRREQLGGGENGIDSLMWCGAMPGFSVDGDVQMIHTGHHRPAFYAEHACRKVRP